jgi:outer membrane protein OmpA-like peptidoglycan-associated protein
MSPVKPMLDDIELKLVQKIDTVGEQVQAQHGVPALEGDFLQGLGRRATHVTLNGVMTGTEATEDLKTLREKFRTAQPVSFVADIATATKVEQVLIEEMGVRELAGKPERFEYALTLRELIEPPATVTGDPPPSPTIPPEPPPSVEIGTLIVEVIVEGEEDFDFNTVTVTANGTQNNLPVSIQLTEHEGGVWVKDDMPPGDYTISAVVEEPQPMAGEADATVRAGETTQVQIILRPGVLIAKAFIIHFRFDSAFVEPCLRQVLRQVYDYGQDHPDEKMVIVGHTDLVGSDDYNQKLSERRARSVYAFLTFGTSDAHREAAVKDWNNLRKKPTGALAPVSDNWSTREYQYMLQDLGYYTGNIDELHGPKTDAAIRAFQTDHSLPATGLLDEATWPVLVENYLAQDALAVPDSQFFKNASEGCDGGVLKWLGCGEKDPVRNTEDAWRPNRRTEMLFVRAEKLPCDVARPLTFDLPEPGVVGTSWCLLPPGKPAPPPCCFLTRQKAAPPKWLVRPAEPGKVLVDGQVVFDDGTPASNEKYVLIAPDGEFLHTDAQGQPDLGERPQGPQRGRPIPNRTDVAGNFRYPRETPVGVYILELPELVNPSVARESGEPPETAIGNVICMRFKTPPGGAPQTQSSLLDAGGPGGVGAAPSKPGATIHPTAPPPVVVNPIIEAKLTAVVVKKSYTKPARVPVTLKVSSRFRRTGTLTRSDDEIRLFTAAVGGTEILFDGKKNVFSGGLLSAPGGVQLFAEAVRPSNIDKGFELTLTLLPGTTPVGPPATQKMTALSLTLDIHESPPASAAMPQPPNPAPAAGTATDKWFAGRVVNVQTGFTQERVKLSVHMLPDDFKGQLTLRQVKVAGTNITGADDKKLDLFDNETQTPGESPLANPFDFDSATVSLLGREFGIEGKEASVTLRDRGFQLGVKEGTSVENDGDRVAVTVGVGAVIFVPPFVVVKKAHTTPTRQAVSLFISAPFPRKGTLTRSRNDVRFFDALTGGNEILFNGTDNVFTGQQLFGTVELFAEGATPSPTENAVVLTLTLESGTNPPAGTPATAKMTAVDLTLDVAVTRTSPATNPAPLSATDKITPGRFVQVKLPNFKHERATLILRKPNPLINVGTLVITPLDATKTELFSDETPLNNQTPLAGSREVASFILAATEIRFFIEGKAPSTAARDAGFRLSIKDQPDEVDRVNVTTVQMEVTDLPNNTVAAATFVRMGLWDKAFNLVAGGPNTLFNTDVEANNFAGADSRKFHFRMRDAASRNNGHVNVNWRTLDRANADLDNPANNFISLVETPANSGVFISRGLILASDDDDRDQRTHHGVPATIPQTPAVASAADNLRARGESNHRVRRGSMFGDMVIEYRPAPGQVLTVRLPVFQRTPDFRRTLPLQIFVLRNATGNPVFSTAANAPLWTRDLRIIREAYERIGIGVNTVVAPGTLPADIVSFQDDRAVLVTPPAALAATTAFDATTQAQLAASITKIANTICLFYIPNFVSSDRGVSYTDVDNTGDLLAMAFVNVSRTLTGPYSPAHEIGHLLTNKSAFVNGGHFNAPTAPAGNRLTNDQNLMRDGTSTFEGVLQSKRLWDDADQDGLNQFNSIRVRPSRFIRT